jgi:hypothetical protein
LERTTEHAETSNERKGERERGKKEQGSARRRCGDKEKKDGLEGDAYRSKDSSRRDSIRHIDESRPSRGPDARIRPADDSFGRLRPLDGRRGCGWKERSGSGGSWDKERSSSSGGAERRGRSKERSCESGGSRDERCGGRDGWAGHD